MRKNVLRTAAITAAAIPILLIIGTGTANAYSPPTVEGGRARIQVTALPAPDLASCRASLNGGPWAGPFGGPGQSVSTLFQNVPTGTTHVVRVECIDAMGGPKAFKPVKVDVASPDPVLDAIDGVLAGVGSSAMTSDPTLG